MKTQTRNINFIGDTMKTLSFCFTLSATLLLVPVVSNAEKRHDLPVHRLSANNIDVQKVGGSQPFKVQGTLVTSEDSTQKVVGLEALDSTTRYEMNKSKTAVIALVRQWLEYKNLVSNFGDEPDTIKVGSTTYTFSSVDDQETQFTFTDTSRPSGANSQNRRPVRPTQVDTASSFNEGHYLPDF